MEMNRSQLKSLISENFGFKTSEIILLEASGDAFYIMIEVCGIQYQAYFDFTNGLRRLVMHDN